MQHNCSLFDKAQGLRVAKTTRNVLSTIIQDSSKSVGDFEIIDNSDLEQIWEWNNTIPADPELCVHDLFVKQARKTPDAQAIKSWDGAMTYAELEKLTSILGAHLSTKGLQPNMVIPICFEKSKWTIVAMMAVLRAGAAFTTLDPNQPTNRLEDTIFETRSNIILVGASQAERFAGKDWDIVSNIPELCEQLSTPPYTKASLAVKSTDLSYVAFTSGSTGKPKGVAQQHLASCSTIIMKSRDGSDSGYGSGKRIMQFASQAFAASVVEIFKTLGNGGCICIPDATVRLNNITGFMKDNGITRVFFTPALLKLFKPEDFPTLEILLVGGEPVLQGLIDIWTGNVKLVEAIGMTEGVAIQTNIKSDGRMTRGCQTLSGVPWIVDPDDHNKLAPIGALGELMVEGPCLAKGYLHDDGKTTAAFIEAPSWARRDLQPNRKFRLYRTGDMARYFSDGVVRLLGRRDNRVKLNGQRIELAEVEHHMQKNIPATMAVAADVVTISNNGKDRSFLAGFIFASTDVGKAGDPEDGLLPVAESEAIFALLPSLKEAMTASLPSYMVPTVFLPFDRRPTNMSGKMDRKRLRQIVTDLSSNDLIAYNKSETQKTAPTTDNEKVLAILWAKLFGIEICSIGIEDNFLMYGGDSLQAINLVRLGRASGYLLTTSNILQNPILKQMSQKIGDVVDDVGTHTAKLLTAEDTVRLQKLVGSYEIEATSIATDWQSWAVSTGLMKTRGWTDYLTFNFKGQLDIVRLESACKTLLLQFPILRTVFVVDKRRTMQVVLKNYPFELRTFEVAGDEEVDTISKQLFEQDAACEALLGQPLVKFALVAGSDTQRLLMRISHAQYDIVSLVSLFRCLKDAYLGNVMLPSPSFIEFVNFTSKQESVEESFWKDLLKGSKMTEIVRQLKPTYTNLVDTTIKQTIALPTLQMLGITSASLVLAAWAIVLGKLSNSPDVVFGRLTSGRHAAMSGIEDVLGPCMNITPVRAQTTSSSTALGFFQEVQAQHLASMAYENTGFRHIIEKCTDWAPWTRFSSIVNYVHVDKGMEDLFTFSENLRYDFDVFEPIHDKSDLWLQTKPVGDQMEIELRFCGDIISRDLADKALKMFCDVVQNSSSMVDKPLSKLTGSTAIQGSSPHHYSLEVLTHHRSYSDYCPICYRICMD